MIKHKINYDIHENIGLSQENSFYQESHKFIEKDDFILLPDGLKLKVSETEIYIRHIENSININDILELHYYKKYDDKYIYSFNRKRHLYFLDNFDFHRYCRWMQIFFEIDSKEYTITFFITTESIIENFYKYNSHSNFIKKIKKDYRFG